MTEPVRKDKRRRINDYEEGFVWGKTAKEDDLKREEFLHREEVVGEKAANKSTTQSVIPVSKWEIQGIIL